MTEAVRLVVWDLDETFWKGTLSEGGIREHVQAHQDIVIELARRGIMSSICSKNDFDAVRAVLQERGLWESFILPSIDWSPKGARLAALVEAVQLRPATVLFIDDNPQNLAEAAACVPGLQVADESIIPTILDSPLFTGKHDPTLTRLRQYKLLERRKADEKAAGRDNAAFLRTCGIRVTVEMDVEAHIDRAVELINRTNQLNFTKQRLPEDPAQARAALREQLRNYGMQAGLIRVVDSYGDYGFVGFYLKSVGNRTRRERLIHYCFSCRTLGMGVEHWFYQVVLGAPWLKVEGEVLTNVKKRCQVDWITFGAAEEAAKMQEEGADRSIVHIRGGCEMSALGHYFALDRALSLVEALYPRAPFLMRYDCSATLVNALIASPEFARSAARLEFDETDLQTSIFAPSSSGAIVLGVWGDMFAPAHRHRATGQHVHVTLEGAVTALPPYRAADFGNWPRDVLLDRVLNGRDPGVQARVLAAAEELRENFDYVGGLAPRVIQSNHRFIFDRIPAGCVLYAVLPDLYAGRDRCAAVRPRAQLFIDAITRAARGRRNVELVSIADCISGPDDRDDMGDHFDRIVYFRLSQKIKQAMRAREARPARVEAVGLARWFGSLRR
jgi:FkbH-like protein